MDATPESRRTVFRRIADRPYADWPVYDATPLYERSSLAGLELDIRTVSQTWFRHDRHESIEIFARSLPLAYFEFDAHDRYVWATRYEMDTLFRVFVLKECHGWEHETALVEYLDRRPTLCELLGLETVPDQSTLWRSWHKRFTAELRSTVETTAQTILIKAQNAGVTVPREPERHLPSHGDEADESAPDDQAVLNEAATITEHVSRVVFPTFLLNRGDGCKIHESVYWDLQTYLGLRENLAANEGARNFIHESTRDRTPLGHGHRDQIRDLSIEQIHEMYRQAVRQLIDEVSETKVPRLSSPMLA